MEMIWDALHGTLVTDCFGSEACNCLGTLVLLRALGAQWVFFFAGVPPKECLFGAAVRGQLLEALVAGYEVMSVDCRGLEGAA